MKSFSIVSTVSVRKTFLISLAILFKLGEAVAPYDVASDSLEVHSPDPRHPTMEITMHLHHFLTPLLAKHGFNIPHKNYQMLNPMRISTKLFFISGPCCN